MITAAQLRAARALLGIDQNTLARLAGLSVPTIQRMEASEGNIRGVIESLTRIVDALDLAGIDLTGEDTHSSSGGRGVRLDESASQPYRCYHPYAPAILHQPAASNQRRR